MHAQWKAWLNGADEAAAILISRRLHSLLPVAVDSSSIGRDHNGLYVSSWSTEVQAPTWGQSIAATLRFAQHLASGWRISGTIDEELSAIATAAGSSNFRVAGVVAISVELVRPSADTHEQGEVWSDGGSVQIRAATAYGDPLDLSADEAREFAQRILAACNKADR